MAQENKLLKFIVSSLEAAPADLQSVGYSLRELNPLIQALQARYPASFKEQTRAWERHQALAPGIADWLAQHARPDLPWRSAANRQAETWRMLAGLVEDLDETESGSGSGLLPVFEEKVIPRLQKRQRDLLEWSNELWAQESLIRYGLLRSLQTQALQAGLDESDIDRAFIEKLEPVLLTYDPRRANHASLRTYAVAVVYRHLLDKLRKMGQPLKILRVASPGDESVPSPLENLAVDYSSQARRESLRQGVEGVVRASLQEIEAAEPDGSRLSSTRQKLLLVDFFKKATTGPDANLSLPQAGQVFRRLIDSKTASFCKDSTRLLDKLLAINYIQLTDLTRGLKLSSNQRANNVQLSQARRILAARPGLETAIIQFLEVTPYQLQDREKLKNNPLKVIDFCFEHLSYFLATPDK